MPEIVSLRVIINTNVLFEGLSKSDGVAGLIVDAWLANVNTTDKSAI